MTLSGFLLLAVPLLLGQGCGKKAPLDGGVFISTDQGESWKQSVLVRRDEERTVTIADVSIMRLTFDPTKPGTLYAGTRGAGLYRSSDRGATWQQIGPASDATVPAYSVSPTVPDTMFSIISPSAYRSWDGGATWERMYIDARGQTLTDVIIDPLAAGQVYLTTNKGEILRSQDGGETWNVHARLAVGITSLHINPVDSRVQYAVSARQIFKTTDAWQTWEDLQSTSLLEYKRYPVLDFFFLPRRPNVLVMSISLGILRSADSGATWTLIPTLFPANTFASTVIGVNDRDLDDVYYVVNKRVIHHSVDGGVNWKTLQSFPGARTITDLLIDHENPSQLYAATLQVDTKKK
ncbi:MAG: hypothetical protein HY341_01180 [Candidatus Kerfeldbacteria bacterium]|nr:hypothetical protein [Candidatus Kerfeldbacteria bacterium]